MVDATNRLDPNGDLCGFPVAAAEVVQVEVAATHGGEQQAVWDLVERGERDCLQRHSAHGRFGLGAPERSC